MRLAELVELSSAIAAIPGRSEKIARLAALVRRMTPEEMPVGVALLSGAPRQGKVGLGVSTLRRALGEPARDAVLELVDVDRALTAVVGAKGKGSAARKVGLVGELLGRATAAEQDFLFRVAIGELRHGALEGILTDAVAAAFGISAAEVRRAAMMSGDLGTVAGALAAEGLAALSRFAVELFRPVQPMLADSAKDVFDALARLGEASLEWKMDGARVQVHKRGDDVEVFTRRLNRATARVPELVAAVRALPARELILDGEAIALDPQGRPRPFQVTMSRFGRKLDVERLRAELPLSTFFFDVLWLDGEPLLDRPQSERSEVLAAAVPDGLLVPRLRTSEPGAAETFLADALAAGHEGLMAKALDAPYAAGRRGAAWLKVKQAHTLDLVVLAAEWGHGRRRGWLSNLHLGARDPEAGSFVMLGKTFKGMTDEMLRWQTERLLGLEVSRDDWTVRVRPELVVEIVFNDVQASPHYPGGVALRFARVKAYRPDKRPEDADTIDRVRSLAPG